MNFKYKAIIQFDGKDFFGWQIQNQTSPTVQEIVNKALEAIFKVPIKTIGSGRTDTAVHAFEHHVVFEAPFEIPCDGLQKALNANLPESIRALAVDQVSKNFRPTNDAKSKEYRYFFSNLEVFPPFLRNHMANISYELDLELMQQACSLFQGKHDFRSFHCTGSNPSSTVREVYHCGIQTADVAMGGVVPAHYVITVQGNGFLKQMVRLMVGAIWAVGRKKLSLSELEREINTPSGKHLSAVAPPQGLYKFSVEY